MIDSDLRDLYQEVILDHGRSPRHFGVLAAASHEAQGHNPLCGDRVHLYLNVSPAGLIEDVSFEGQGCAISIASASMMSDLLQGKTIMQARSLARAFYRLAKGESVNGAIVSADAERLAVMSGVSQFPMRIKCATMAWHTFEAACCGEGGATEPVLP